MMSYFFLTSTASVWIAILYMFLGLPLLLNPVASGTFFIWALAAGSAVYAVSHLVRYIQGRKEGLASGGDLFLTVVPLLFTVASLIWPQTLLAFLPLVLGSLLLLDGIGKIPLAFLAAKAGTPDTLALILSAVLPVVLGALIVINPFQTVQLVVRIFGLGLIADGIIDFAVVLTARRSQAG